MLQEKEGVTFVASEVDAQIARDAGLRGLRGNPLLLTMMALFYKAYRRLPADRLEFYRHAEERLRDAWVRHRMRTLGASAARHAPSVLEDLIPRQDFLLG